MKMLESVVYVIYQFVTLEGREISQERSKILPNVLPNVSANVRENFVSLK